LTLSAAVVQRRRLFREDEIANALTAVRAYPDYFQGKYLHYSYLNGIVGSGKPAAGCDQELKPYFIAGNYRESNQSDTFALAREAFTRNLRRLTGLEAVFLQIYATEYRRHKAGFHCVLYERAHPLAMP